MILVDKRKGSIELLPFIKRIGVPVSAENLEFGDVYIEGNGPNGKIAVGIERKTLHDMLRCIEDSRYTGHQRIGMQKMYAKSILALEGNWKPHDPDGLMMEGWNDKWGYCNPSGRKVMYSKLYRYLMSVALSGVIITYSRDLFHTAFNCCEIYHYFQKPWDKHTSLLEIQKMAIPTLDAKPTLVRRWADALDDIGVKYGMAAEAMFKKPIVLAKADELDWMRIPGIGAATAKKIIREIHGW